MYASRAASNSRDIRSIKIRCGINRVRIGCLYSFAVCSVVEPFVEISELERLCFNMSLVEAFDGCSSRERSRWSTIGRAVAFSTGGHPLGEVGLVLLRIDLDMPPGVVGLRMPSPSFIKWLYFSRLLRILPIWLVFAWRRLTISPFCVSSCSHSYKGNMSRNGEFMYTSEILSERKASGEIIISIIVSTFTKKHLSTLV